MSIDRYAVTDNQTGAVLKIGYTDFANDHDPATQTPILLASDSSVVQDVPHYYQKIVGGYFEEMTPAEKAAVDAAKIPPQPTARRHPDSETDPEVCGDGDRYFNTLLGFEMQYDTERGKWLSVIGATIHAEHNGTTAIGAYFKGSDGRVMSATRGIAARYKGTVVAINYTRDNSDPTTFEIVADGEPIAEIASSLQNDFFNHLDGDFEQGEVLALRNRADGAPTKYTSLDVEIRWRV